MSRIHLDDVKDVDPLLVSGTLMSHDMPQEGSEPRQSDGVVRQRSGVPGTVIGELDESDVKTTNKVTARDREARLNLMRLRLWLIVAIVLIVILLIGNGGLIALTTAIYKDTYVKGDTTLSNAKGQVVGTRAATHNLPLLVAPVLPDNELFSVETIHFKVPTNNLSPNGNGGGKVGLSDVVNSRRISVGVSRVEKVNSTAVVFYGLGGEEIRVWNGVTTARLSATGAETPICSADVTCAAFHVEGAELAEKYLAEAEAQLEPFAESRRRLMACEDPSTWVADQPAQNHAPSPPAAVPDKYGSKPNLAIMLIDDLGWSDTEYGGSADSNTTYPGAADFGLIKTPVMKRLEKESIKLERHYSYSWCAPSRSSLISGRLPVHVNVNHSIPTAYVQSAPLASGEGIPAGMTTIGTQLQSAGYKTHYVGKWGVGWTWKGQNPIERGFDTFFGYLHDSVDFWDEKRGYQSVETPAGCEKVNGNGNPKLWAKYPWQAHQSLPTDLVRFPDASGNQSPARGENGTSWVDYQFLNESLKHINEHDTSQPFFLFHAFHSTHTPLNVPKELYQAEDNRYAPAPCETKDSLRPDLTMRDCFFEWMGPSRKSYAAMITWTDKAIGDMIQAFKDKDMWSNTLMVTSADNGGPQYLSNIGYQLWGSGNNLPLRGGKTSDWEGGVRVNSFVTGGLLAGSPMLGGSTSALMQFADWFGTFSYLAGVKQKDQVAIDNGLPDVDSINMWPALWSNASKPRQEIHISPVTLISYGGKYKLLTGPDPGNINSHTTPGYVPMAEYAVGYYNGPGVTEKAGLGHGIVVAGAVAASCGIGKLGSKADNSRDLNISAVAARCGLGDSEADKSKNIIAGYELQCPSPGMDCSNGCLYDLENDPTESTNLAQNPDYADIFANMTRMLAEKSTPWSPNNTQGVFNPPRNGFSKDCAPGGKLEHICGADYCSDELEAYNTSCYPNCFVCPPGECCDKDCPAGQAPVEKIQLKGCTSVEQCHTMAYKTGFYSWVAEKKK